MKPLWVIDIREGKHARLEACIAAVNRQQADCWRYTPFTPPPAGDLEAYCRASTLLLREARVEVNRLLEQKGLNSGNFPICILGDISSARTRSFLPFMAILLKQHWGKVLPVHVGVGVSVGAFLHIPADANQQEATTQKAYHRFLEVLNLLKEKLPAQTYDYLIPYSDIQAVGKQAYPKLPPDRQEELVFQYLLSLYYSGTHSQLPFMRSARSCFYALGASSVFYDAACFRTSVARTIEQKMQVLFSEISSDAEEDLARRMSRETERLLAAHFDDACISFTALQPLLACNEADLVADLKTMQAGKGLHPIAHFYRPLLYPAYYRDRLKYLPASLNEYLQFYADRLQTGLVLRLKENRLRTLENVKKTIDTLVCHFWDDPDYHYKTLPQLENALSAIVSKAEAQHKQMKGKAEASPVSPIAIPRYLLTQTEEINTSEGKITKQTILEELKATLQKEPTFMSAMVRCLLVGTSGVFCILPLLKFLSPRFLNLGQISGSEPLWITLIFGLPFIYTLVWVFHRRFKLVKKLKNRLLAYTLSRLQTKLKSTLAEESAAFYDQLSGYCRQLLADCVRLREAYKLPLAVENEGSMETFFNRPLHEFITGGPHPTEEKLTVGPGREVGADCLTDDDLYTLLAKGVNHIGCSLFTPLPEDTEALKEKVGEDRKRMFATLQSHFSNTETLDIGHLVHRLLLKKAEAVNFQALMALAYPSGLFADSVCVAPEGNLRASYALRIPSAEGKFKLTEDAEGDSTLMLFTAWQEMNDLSSFHFLDPSIVQRLTQSDFSIELACYYAFYGPSGQSGRIGGVIVSREKLSEMNERLAKWEEEV